MIPNPNQITAELRMMNDQQLRQYAELHKNDPYIFPMTVAESTARQKLRMMSAAKQMQPQPTVRDAALMQMDQEAMQEMLPEEVGIGALPAPNLEQMADGGIVGGDEGYDMGVGYAGGGYVDRYQDRGLTEAGMREEIAALPKSAEGEDIGAVRRRIQADINAIREEIATQQRSKLPENTKAQNIATLQAEMEKRGTLLAQLGGEAPVGRPSRVMDMIPIRSAIAADKKSEEPRKGPSREELIAQIPGGAPTTPQREYSTGERAIGAGETALSLASGIPAYVLGAGETGLGLLAALGRKLTGGEAKPPTDEEFARNIGKYVYSPRGEAGREMTEDVSRAIASVVPPYNPSMGMPSRAGAATQAGRDAQAAADAAAAARGKVASTRLAGPSAAGMSPEAAAAAKAKAEALRLLPPGATPEQQAAAMAAMRADREAAAAARQAPTMAKQAAAREQSALAALKADQEAALAATGRAGEAAETAARATVAGERAAEAAQYGADVARRGTMAGTAAAATQAATPSVSINPAQAQKEADKLTPDQQNTLIEAAKAAAPEAEKKEGWSRNDWLTFGFSMLASKSPNFAEALGTAGLKVLASRKEEEESAINRMAKQALADKYKAEAEYVKSEKVREGLRRAAVQLSQAQINALRSNPKTLAMSEEQRKAAEEQIINDNFNRLLQQRGMAPEGAVPAPAASAGNRPPLSSFQK